MRILMVNHEFTITGSSTAFFRLARHLRDGGHAITILPCNPADGPMKERYGAAGIPVAANIALRDFDLAIANTICAAPAVLQIGAHLRTIWFVNEAEVALSLLQKNAGWRDAFRLARAVIVNMPFQLDVLRSYTYNLEQSKFSAIPFGVDIDPAALQRDRVPAKTRALRVVQVGTMEPRKRPGDLIMAVAHSNLDLECVICGKLFHIEPEARAIAEADPQRFRLLSDLPDGEVLAWVESADMFCLASGSETQSLAAYEAALLARPLLLSDLPCYHDVFRHGRNCLLFPPGHVELLALSMGMLAASARLRAQLGQAAQRTAQRFTNDVFFARFDTLLRGVAAAA